MKGMTIGALAALAITGMADAAIIFFTDEIAFNQALADAGKTLKGIEDFDQALIPPFQSALLSDPLNINNLQGLFRRGDFIDNLAFQSNTNGTGSVNDPGVNGLNPRGKNGGINAAINGDEVVVAPGANIETINFFGKAITLRDSGGPEVTVIDGDGLATVAADNEEDWT